MFPVGQQVIQYPVTRVGADGTVIRDFGPMPLAALRALGSSVASGGDVAWDTTAQGMVVCVWSAEGASSWTHLSARRGIVERVHWDQFDETANGWTIIASTGGAVVTTGTTGIDATHPGVLEITIDGQAQSRAGVRRAGAAAAGGVVVGSLPIVLEWNEFHDTLPVATTNEFMVFDGLVNNTSTAEPSDGCYFFVDWNSGNWFAKTANASTRTPTNTGVAATINIWRSFRIEITATRVRFWIDGALVATHTTNINSTTRLIPLAYFMFRPAANGGAVKHLVDYSHHEIITGVSA